MRSNKWILFQVIGATWYLLSIERQDTCWRRACTRALGQSCSIHSLYCKKNNSEKNEFLRTSCPIDQANATAFDFGIYLSSLQSEIVRSRDFPQKFFYCFWWGLQNLRFVHSKILLIFHDVLIHVFLHMGAWFIFGSIRTYSLESGWFACLCVCMCRTHNSGHGCRLVNLHTAYFFNEWLLHKLFVLTNM